MLVHSQEKKMLIESMKKLTGHVAGNAQRQKDIFQALSLNDFNKIVSNLTDQNQYLRRISALFLCELFFENRQTKEGVVALLGIQPSCGRICLGGIPQLVCRHPSTLKIDARAVAVGYSQFEIEEQSKICWVINLERKNLRLQLLDNKKYSSFTFIDPEKNIFGFSLARDSQLKESLDKSMQADSTRYSIGSQKMEERMMKTSLDHYKQYAEERERSKQKQKIMPVKYSLNLSYEPISQRRNSTSSTGSAQYRNQLLASQSIKKQQQAIKISSIRPVTSYTEKQKLGYTKGSKPSHNIVPKWSMTESQQGWQYRHNQSHYPEINTDRSVPAHRYGTPVSTRQSEVREQQRFYKRVKGVIPK